MHGDSQLPGSLQQNKAQSHSNWSPISWKRQLHAAWTENKQAAKKKPHATPNKKDYWVPSVWQQELTRPSIDKTAQFQCVTTIMSFVSECAEIGRERLEVCSSSDNLCLSCQETAQTCLTVLHSTLPTDSEGLASIVYLQADTNISCQYQCFNSGSPGRVVKWTEEGKRDNDF